MIDREIQNALKVNPSPEFLAHVRTRIAGEAAPSAWRWSWTLAAAGAMAASLVVALVVSRPPAAISSAPVAQPFRAASDDAGLKPRATEEGATKAPAARASRPVPAALKPRAADAPEILLDPAETRALRALIVGVRDGRVDLTAVLTSEPPAPMALEPVTDIVIAPITIDPIAPPPGAEGARP